MSLRMGRYLFEFYQEIQKLDKSEYLNPSFPILIYNGDAKWTAPERFSELLYKSDLPNEYIPEFRYFKIAINEIDKRDLVKIRNAVSTIFYIENSSAADIGKNRKVLVSLLSAVLKKDGAEIVKSIIDRIYQIQKLPKTSKVINTVQDLTEVSSMLESNTKKWEQSVLDRGIEQGIEKGIGQIIDKLIQRGMKNSDIRTITGLPFSKIDQLRKNVKKTNR